MWGITLFTILIHPNMKCPHNSIASHTWKIFFLTGQTFWFSKT